MSLYWVRMLNSHSLREPKDIFEIKLYVIYYGRMTICQYSSKHVNWMAWQLL